MRTVNACSGACTELINNVLNGNAQEVAISRSLNVRSSTSARRMPCPPTSPTSATTRPYCFCRPREANETSRSFKKVTKAKANIPAIAHLPFNSQRR